jgi:hypothetical protein
MLEMIYRLQINFQRAEPEEKSVWRSHAINYEL